MELYSLKFEIDFGVITDRGVFIEEILAEVHNKVNQAFVEPGLNGFNNHLVWEKEDGRLVSKEARPYEAYMNQKEQLFLLQLSICQFHMIAALLCRTIFSVLR